MPVAPTLLERHLKNYEKSPELRFISDGDPNAISVYGSDVGRVATDRWPSKQIRTTIPAVGPPTEGPPAGEGPPPELINAE